MAAATRILSIDGGGVRGVIPAMVLDHIERECGKPVCELFDVIAGTSTGGIIALGLTCPGRSRKPRYSAADLVGLYEEEGRRIFPHELFGRIRQLAEEKYSSSGLEDVLRERFGDTRLKDALTGVLVTAYDIERRQPIFFRSERATESADHDFLMRDVARATSAAPTYFEPARLAARRPQVDYALVDGGVFANNPGMCAFVDRYAGRAETEGLLMVSLGTGVLTNPLRYDDARGWGLIGWARPILDVVFDGVSDTVDYQLGQILGDRYHRFQTELHQAHDELDDASEQNIEDLKLAAEGLVEGRRRELDALCEQLTG